jgi:glycine oxidase
LFQVAAPMSENSVDYLIVGQGLAGSCIAWQLIKRQKKIAVIDLPGNNLCTSKAAGLFNPVTGQNITKTWLADETFSYLHQFYREIQDALHVRFFFPLSLYRPFSTIEEQNEWMSRSIQPNFQSVLREVHTESMYPEVRDELGGIVLKSTGFIDTNILMASVRKFILENAIFLPGYFSHDKLLFSDSRLKFDNITASKVIFCEGAEVSKNPWFKSLPIRPLKGETMIIKTAFKKQVILNRGVYMVPESGGMRWKVGSTYNLQDKTLGNTEKGKTELIAKLKLLLKDPFEIVSEDWGIRPTSVDRRPVLGAHPMDDRLIIFNGLGTKGVSLAPYFSDILVRQLENGVPLTKEVDVTRFKVLS